MTDPEQVEAVLLLMPPELRGQAWVHLQTIAFLDGLDEGEAPLEIEISTRDVLHGLIATVRSLADALDVDVREAVKVLARMRPVDFGGGRA